MTSTLWKPDFEMSSIQMNLVFGLLLYSNFSFCHCITVFVLSFVTSYSQIYSSQCDAAWSTKTILTNFTAASVVLGYHLNHSSQQMDTLETLNTVSIRIPDESGFWMVDLCPVVERSGFRMDLVFGCPVFGCLLYSRGSKSKLRNLNTIPKPKF